MKKLREEWVTPPSTASAYPARTVMIEK